ncbi:MAG: 50S ribosome-binding GTPase [Betaproteobacteria bacterium]|nr:50S ribosome-binding GTPase [Betaproteobacteria bacterium]
MKSFFTEIDPLRIVVPVLLILPLLAVFGFGLLWLWQSGYILHWLIAMLVFGSLGYGLQQLLIRRERKLLAEAVTKPNPAWPPNADVAWQQVESLAQKCEPQDWPLDDEAWIFDLGQRTLESVARCYHPDVERPLLELTLPHTLLIIERASRDLRLDVAQNIPFSNRLTIGDFFRLQRWKDKAEKVFNIYRAGRAIVNPVNALLGEAWRHFRERSVDQARTELHRWFLRAYVRKVGFYAIDLYSGRLPLQDYEAITTVTPTSNTELDKIAETTEATEEPLRILVLGRSNAGKSSLINALFGALTTAVDVLPDTTQSIKPFALSRDGLTQALIFDSPGYDGLHFDDKKMQAAAENADLILWVSPANRPDRQDERNHLDALRASQSARVNHRPPPLIVVVSHIDLLRPAAEWQPPYDLANQQSTKAINIHAAVQTVATDLATPIDRVIPACLADGKIYNVDDALWATLLDHQDEALRVRLLRCLDAKKRAEDWVMLRHQMISAGRFLRDLPGIFDNREGK